MMMVEKRRLGFVLVCVWTWLTPHVSPFQPKMVQPGQSQYHATRKYLICKMEPPLCFFSSRVALQPLEVSCMANTPILLNHCVMVWPYTNKPVSSIDCKLSGVQTLNCEG